MSCRGGRDLVLQYAPKAKARLSAAAMALKPLKHLRSALQQRGSLPVALAVTSRATAETSALPFCAAF